MTAVLLIAYATVGFTGPTLFEMHPRGTGASDVPHIAVTAVLVLLTLQLEQGLVRDIFSWIGLILLLRNR